MDRSNGRSGRKANGRAEWDPRAAAAPLPPVPDEATVRREVRETILRAAPGLVASAIERAEAGSCPHLKFLFELAGLQVLTADAPARPTASLRELLCRLDEEDSEKQ